MDIVEYKKSRINQKKIKKGNCLDNSPMENFLGILKQKMYYSQTYTSYEQLKQLIDFILNTTMKKE